LRENFTSGHCATVTADTGLPQRQVSATLRTFKQFYRLHFQEDDNDIPFQRTVRPAACSFACCLFTDLRRAARLGQFECVEPGAAARQQPARRVRGERPDHEPDRCRRRDPGCAYAPHPAPGSPGPPSPPSVSPSLERNGAGRSGGSDWNHSAVTLSGTGQTSPSRLGATGRLASQRLHRRLGQGHLFQPSARFLSPFRRREPQAVPGGSSRFYGMPGLPASTTGSGLNL